VPLTRDGRDSVVVEEGRWAGNSAEGKGTMSFLRLENMIYQA
jgi:hypothetical protein